jgi:histidine triad (HIT) family protein
MQPTPEQQQAMEAQKAQCPFCKIVKGEIPSKKVYEDDLLLGVLDINPAAKGHILLMPKEHYPIMPLIPPETFEHLFAKTKLMSKAAKEGVLTFADTVYIANGYAAGQQSSHFMLHIIPREDMDGLDFFTLKKGSVDKAKLEEAFKMLKNNLPIMLRNRYAKYPLEGKAPVGAPGGTPSPGSPTGPVAGDPTGRQYTRESLIQLIETNPQLKSLVTEHPDEFRKQVGENDRLKQLFEHIDLDDIIGHFAPATGSVPSATDLGNIAQQVGMPGQSSDESVVPPQPPQSSIPQQPLPEQPTPQPSSQLPEEGEYSMDDLVQIVNDNPKLKDLLLKQTYKFAEKIQEIPALKKIFGDVDIEELERAVLRKEVREEQDVGELLGSYSEELAKPQFLAEDENPAMINADDPSVSALEESEINDTVEQQNEQNNEQESNIVQQREPERHEAQQEKQETEDDEDDLISKLHKEMLRRQV